MSFHHAAVSKGLMLGCAITSIAASIFDVKYYLHLQLVPHISRHHQYWRLFVHHLACSNSAELLLIEVILYNVGIPIERMFGSVKYASFAIVVTLASTLLEFIALLLFNRIGLNVLPSGPTPLVFAVLYQFFRLIPPAYSFRIFGVSATNKAFNYLLAFQLAISQPPGSITLSVLGLLAGALYRSDALGLKSYRISPSFQRFGSRWLLPLIGSTKPPRLSNRALPDENSTPVADVLSRSLSATAQGAVAAVTRPGANDGSSGAATGRSSGQRSTAADDRDTVVPVEDGVTRGVVNEARSTVLPSRHVVQGWVDELTGRSEPPTPGLRVPSQDEITTVTSIFPTLRREDIVGALQRSPNVEAAVETLLQSQR